MFQLALMHATNAEPAADSTPCILAFDLGTATGWALRSAEGLITSGTASFRPGRFDGGGMRYLRFANWQTEFDRLSGPFAAILIEGVHRHAGADASPIYGGLMATLTDRAEQEARYQGHAWDARIGRWLTHDTRSVNRGHAGYPDWQDEEFERPEPLSDVSVGEILEGALRIEPANWTKSDQMRVGAWLRSRSWERYQSRLGSARARRYRKPLGIAETRRSKRSAYSQFPG